MYVEQSTSTVLQCIKVESFRSSFSWPLKCEVKGRSRFRVTARFLTIRCYGGCGWWWYAYVCVCMPGGGMRGIWRLRGTARGGFADIRIAGVWTGTGTCHFPGREGGMAQCASDKQTPILRPWTVTSPSSAHNFVRKVLIADWPDPLPWENALRCSLCVQMQRKREGERDIHSPPALFAEHLRFASLLHSMLCPSLCQFGQANGPASYSANHSAV